MNNHLFLAHPEIIHFVEKDCTPDWQFLTNRINFYSFTFILNGQAEYEVDGQAYFVCKGDIIFVKPGSLRHAKTTGMTCVAVDFILPSGQSLDFPNCFHWGNMEDFRILFRDLKFEWLEKREGYYIKCQALFMLVLHKLLYECNETKNIHVENMKQFIMKNYTEDLTVAMVAKHVNLNSVYCGQLFKKVEKQTIASFINKVRINQSISLLDTGKNITEVAEETGFTDIYYFSNMFKKIVGVSPSAYKRRNFTVK